MWQETHTNIVFDLTIRNKTSIYECRFSIIEDAYVCLFGVIQNLFNIKTTPYKDRITITTNFFRS